MKAMECSTPRRVFALRRVSWFLIFWCAVSSARGDAQPWTTAVCLTGQSSGGVLALGRAWSVGSPYIVVTNQPGDKAETVLRRLAVQLTAAEFTFTSPMNMAHMQGGVRVPFTPAEVAAACNPVSSVANGRLVLFGANPWMFGGTDTGFSIPAPVTSLSASFIEEGRKVILRWTNPPGGYERIHVVFKGTDDYPGLEALGRLGGLPGNTTEYVHRPRDPSEPLLWSSDVDAIVVGYSKDGTPSNGTGIRLLNHVRQESLMDIPFTQGLAPGLQTWTDRSPSGNVEAEQGNLSGAGLAAKAALLQLKESYQDVGQMAADLAEQARLREKRFFQMVSGSGTCCGGVWRTFLGLTPGHAYRASARMNTLQAKAGAWSWSFHAAANPPGQSSLTPEQMSGMADLPDHTKGPAAGQIARYDYATATQGEWVLRSSEVAGPGKPVGDITLPDGCDSLTLWFRLEGTNVTDTALGLDSVAVEDLGKR